MAKSRATKTAEAVVDKTTATPVVEAPVEKVEAKVEAPAEKKAPKFDATKVIKNAVIAQGTTHVWVTNDGQVFLPHNENLARKHAHKNNLELTKHDI